ncbi:MAG: penicillin-binding transpeptidase domain-containing protein [Dermatophilaceae bacterium]
MTEPQNPDHAETVAGWNPPPKRSSRGKFFLVGLICVALLAGVGVFVVVHSKSAVSMRRQQASAAATQFLRTWASGNLSALPAQTVTGSAAVAQAYASLDGALGITTKPNQTGGVHATSTSSAARLPIKVQLGTPIGSGELITVPATITIDVPGLGTWRDPVELRVRTSGNKALIDWSPQAIAPTLKADDHVQVTRTLPRRAAILGADGQPVPNTFDVSALVGAVGPATTAQAKADPTLRAGDLVGQSGLEQANDAALRGSASGDLTVVDPAGHTVATLAQWVGRAPAPVSSTVNPTMQAAAAQAIAHTGHPSALVAIDARTGAVLAAASNPAGYPRALLGQYPPGSTFKMVTLTAALTAGRTLTSPTTCSPTAVVDGYSFRNASGEAFGTIPLQQAFAVSCNTSFINLAQSLPAGTLTAAAKLLGCDIGHPPLPVPSFGCSYPAGATGTAYAATAIGQGTVLTSPLSIASIAAAADSGTWNQPHLTPGPAPVSHPLPAAVTAGLQAAMRAVVTSGTGTGANLPGTPVFGKTGTAEHGSGKNPPTDAWFAAFRGDVAVAVVVEDAGFGATSAVPVAAGFLGAVTR